MWIALILGGFLPNIMAENGFPVSQEAKWRKNPSRRIKWREFVKRFLTSCQASDGNKLSMPNAKKCVNFARYHGASTDKASLEAASFSAK